jgi:O-antigen/teichoic acid export membrane protein
MTMEGASVFRPRFAGFLDANFRHVARNSLWAIATTAVVVASVFIETILLARYLGARGFGVYVLIIAYPEAVQMVLDFRTREAMTRYLGEFLARKQLAEAVAVVKLLFVVDAVVLMAAFGIVITTAGLVAPWLTDRAGAASLMQIYAIAVLLGGLDTTAGSVLRVFDRFGLSFLTGGGVMLLRLAIIAMLISGGAGLHGLIWGRVGAEAIRTLFIGGSAAFLLKRALWAQRRATPRALAPRRREIARFLMHMNLQGTVRAVASKLDVLTVGALAGPSAASLYKIAMQFGSSLLLLSDPLFVAVYPMFTRWRALGRIRELRSVGRKLSLVLCVLAVPIACFLVFKSRLVISAAVGSEFAAASTPMIVILLGVLPAVVLFWARAVMLAEGDTGIATKIAVGSVVAQFAVLLTFVQAQGALGGAVAFTVSNLVTVVASLIYLRRRTLL